MPATNTLPDCANDALENAIDKAADKEPVVLWWDEGGHLADIVQSESAKLDCEFHAVEETPLELRAEAPRERTVWYVPQAPSDDLDWFRDVENTGGVVEQHIGKLAARCFESERLQAASIRTAYEDADADEREQIAKTLYEELNGDGGLPSLQGLQAKIVLDGHEDPVQFVLENDAANLPDGDDLLQIRDLLVDNDVGAVKGATDAETIVDRTRRWAVAQWLVDAGLERSTFPPEYQPPENTGIGISRPELQSVLSKTDRPGDLAAMYLDPEERFWSDILEAEDDPWELAECPVSATLEHRLWETWAADFDAEEYERCASRATQRHERLADVYGDVPWTAVWKQAVDVAELAAELDAWEDEGDTDDVVTLYGDPDDGTWQIDNAVFNLIVSGDPETELPADHPATGALDELRNSLIETRYLEYLTELGDLVVDQIESGGPFLDENHAHQFFAEEEDHLESGESVALFIVDALRYDLAHQLAESIRDELPALEVDEDTWIGTLPSDTEFGKAALTPGSKFGFSVELDDGELIPARNGREITNHWREELLENDGWAYIMEEDSEAGDAGWSKSRVAYYWNDIDATGEKELTDFESVFEDRIEAISRIICEKLDKGNWERAYILSDHGFVSLPKHVDIDDIHPPEGAQDITRRWIAGQNLDADSPGALLDESTQLGYLDGDTTLNALADPIQRYRNQGLPDARFYHGGVLPQEFVLNFVTITQE
jgi:hypothetical protein